MQTFLFRPEKIWSAILLIALAVLLVFFAFSKTWLGGAGLAILEVSRDLAVAALVLVAAFSLGDVVRRACRIAVPGDFPAPLASLGLGTVALYLYALACAFGSLFIPAMLALPIAGGAAVFGIRAV